MKNAVKLQMVLRRLFRSWPSFPLFIVSALAVPLILSGCASSDSFRVHTPPQTTSNAPTIVLLNQTHWEATLRAELAKRNFNLVKLPSNDLVMKKGADGGISRISNESNIRYGMLFLVNTRLTCPHNAAEWIIGALEITDLKTNQVVFSIEVNEWTEPCAFRGTDGFNQLMNLFAKTWGEKIKP